jgi:hypothetical protein
MKQKDIALIAVIVVFSAIVSLLVSNMFFASPAKRQQQVEVVEPISAEFQQPDSRYFNNTAFDPTKLITIGQSQNPEPFKSSSQ